MAKIEKRTYQSVSALDVDVLEYTPAAGKPLVLLELGGSAAYSPDTTVTIIWDYGGVNEILFSTNGDSRQNPEELFREGDGSKKLAIVLTNNRVVSSNMGGFWIGTI